MTAVIKLATLNINAITNRTRVGTGSDMRGTAIVASNNIVLMNINKLKSGRAITAQSKGLYIVNIYAPSGTVRRTEREYSTMSMYHNYYKSGTGKSS